MWLTNHARQRARQRGVTFDHIVETVANAAVIEPDPARGCRRYVGRDGLVVVVANDGAVVTLLLREQAQWNNDDCRRRWGS